MITVENLSKSYHGRYVVQIESLYLNAGERIGLVGNNGAGKTTLFRMMLDLIRPDSGQIEYKGRKVSESEHWKTFTAAYLDEGFLPDYLTPEEYFYFVGSLVSLNRRSVDAKLEMYSEFFQKEILGLGKYIRDLSKGNQTKVGIAGCLLQDLEILLLDEPFANIDPSTQIRLKNILRNFNGMSVISSHDLNHVTDLCSRILLMENGRIIKDIATSDSTLQELEEYFSVPLVT